MSLRRICGRRLTAVLAVIGGAVAAGSGAEIFINEIHYDNAGTDTGEGIEIAGPAGTGLSGWQLAFYNGSGGATYRTELLSGILPNEGGTGLGAIFFAVNAIQNGPADAVALVGPAPIGVAEFLSWEGAVTATGGPAAGMTSTDIGLNESSSTPTDYSLQRTGSGRVGEDFLWTGPALGSPGLLNAGQIVTGRGTPALALTADTVTVSEGDAAVSITVTLSPPPESPIEAAITVSDPSSLAAPAFVTIPESGSAAFALDAIADGARDGHRRVTLTVTDQRGLATPAAIDLVVLDADAVDLRGDAIRITTFNLKDGAGSPGSAQAEAVKAIVRRIDPHVIAFQEVSAANGFADLKSLLADVGFGVTREFLALAGDDFEDAPYKAGDFSGGHALALASRFPISETLQVGRGRTDAREFTRYPLYASVDVPNVPDVLDPSFIVVHCKAGSTMADRFRKAVEGFRTVEFLAARGRSGAGGNVFAAGDFNEDLYDAQPASFSTAIDPSIYTFSDGSSLPVSYVLGSDIAGENARTLPYASFPDTPFRDLGMHVLPAVQVNGSDRTRNDLSPRRLDYILAGSRTLGHGNAFAEVYNPALEHVSLGLPKAGPPLPSDTGRAASDHHPVFVDISLVATPRITVTLDIQEFPENAGSRAVTGAVRLSAAPPTGSKLTVTLDATPFDEVAPVPRTLVFPPGALEMPIALAAFGDRTPDPHRVAVVGAGAPGYSSGFAAAVSRNLEASGAFVFSQYAESDSGTSPKAIELLNRTGGAVDLARTPIEVRTFTNGSLTSFQDALVEAGLVPDGGALVIGDAATGDFLVASGVIPEPMQPWASFFTGTVFADAAGSGRFVIDPFTFNGNDAMEVLFNHVRADVFGTIGHDPGAAWVDARSGISTANQNLERLAHAVHGSAGFTDPALRFAAAGAGSSLDGFGVAPAMSSPYEKWAAASGLTGADAAPWSDPDRDRRLNALEYYQVTDAARAERTPPCLTPIREDDDLLFAIRERAGVIDVIRTIEFSLDGMSWQQIPVTEASSLPHPDGSRTVLLQPDPSFPRATSILIRLAVTIL